MIAKFLGTICQDLSKVCIAIGAHIKPVIQGKSNRTLALPIYAAKMSLPPFDLTDFISCTLVHLWSQL